MPLVLQQPGHCKANNTGTHNGDGLGPLGWRGVRTADGALLEAVEAQIDQFCFRSACTCAGSTWA